MGIAEEIEHVNKMRSASTFGKFITPADIPCNAASKDPVDKYRIKRRDAPRAHADYSALAGRLTLFDHCVARIRQNDWMYAEQCTPKYYFDLIAYLHKQKGQIERVAEVGVFLGGGSAFLALAAVELGYELHLIDLNPQFLGYTFERVLAIAPEAEGRVKIFHGDFPSYVEKGHLLQKNKANFAQFDASHRFPDVVRDMVAVCRGERWIKSFAIQDTHLRSHYVEGEVFVDMAVYSVFGLRPKFRPIGSMTSSRRMDLPNSEWKLFMRPNAPEGMLLELKDNPCVYRPRGEGDDAAPMSPAEEVKGEPPAFAVRVKAVVAQIAQRFRLLVARRAPR